jgi:hypothetical protein
VEYLTLSGEVHSHSSDEHNEIDRTEWHKLLRSFHNVKLLRIEYELVEEIFRCLRPDGGDLSSDLFPELQELTYPGGGDADDVFTSFIDARRTAGRPITLVRRRISLDTCSSTPPCETISSLSSGAGITWILEPVSICEPLSCSSIIQNTSLLSFMTPSWIYIYLVSRGGTVLLYLSALFPILVRWLGGAHFHLFRSPVSVRGRGQWYVSVQFYRWIT